jgi:hypothetical protein
MVVEYETMAGLEEMKDDREGERRNPCEWVSVCEMETGMVRETGRASEAVKMLTMM